MTVVELRNALNELMQTDMRVAEYNVAVDLSEDASTNITRLEVENKWKELIIYADC